MIPNSFSLWLGNWIAAGVARRKSRRQIDRTEDKACAWLIMQRINKLWFYRIQAAKDRPFHTKRRDRLVHNAQCCVSEDANRIIPWLLPPQNHNPLVIPGLKSRQEGKIWRFANPIIAAYQTPFWLCRICQSDVKRLAVSGILLLLGILISWRA